MSGNLSVWVSTSAKPLHSTYVFYTHNVSASGSPPPWEAPSFTVAARCRVAATLVLFVFAAISNLSVLISVCWGRGYRLAAHLRPLIASLASADLMMTFVVMPLDAIWNITVQWYAGSFMCKLLCFLKLFAMHAAVFILVVVSLDRYRAILQPLDSLDAGLRNKRMVLAAWILSLLLAAPQLFIFRAIKADGADFTQCVTHGSFPHRWQETAYNMFQFVTLYVFPLLVMIFCYTRILTKINGQMQKSKDGEHCLRRSGTDIIPKARMKTLKMTIVIVSSFVICWTPYYLLGIWYWFQPSIIKHTPEYVHHILFVFGNLNTCCDPVIYGFYTASFRADVADVVVCCRGRQTHNALRYSVDHPSGHSPGASGEMESDLSSNQHNHKNC
ncbi:gonadotropin releasing hormone receptor 1 isoform X1 [Betta splendens]|uniref:Type II GnRH receptor n=1 Tax=Betta splendens TaxID=158456 RepID=A0A6P7NVH1_BETSP|nr:gonadotropin releasing hormone receptor 1 isoform X1 [Betta splendens]XP_055368835.1 gonadotropin releasing hormone receptor 1 isoform X1 [Betta splendens]